MQEFHDVGHILCDMTGKYLKTLFCDGKKNSITVDEITYEVVSYVDTGFQMRSMIEENVRNQTSNPRWSYVNRWLAVVGRNQDEDQIVAAYSYDGRRGGLVTLKVPETVVEH